MGQENNYGMAVIVFDGSTGIKGQEVGLNDKYKVPPQVKTESTWE